MVLIADTIDTNLYLVGDELTSIAPSNVFYWDCKRNNFDHSVDLKNVFLLFGFKEFEHLPCITERFTNLSKKIFTILSSYQGKIDFYKFSTRELIPQSILLSFFQEKNSVLSACINHLYEEFGNDFDNVLNFFQNRFNNKILQQTRFSLKIKEGISNVDLTFASNFRFKTINNSFNLFTLPKDKRDLIIPQDEDSFIFAMDFKAFEFRTFLKLINFEIDFDDRNLYEYFGKLLNLETQDVKVKIIAYLYGKYDAKLDELFHRQTLKNQINNKVFCWNDYPVIVEPNGNEVHTIVQTISQYIYLEKLTHVINLLQNYKSKFIYPFHDCLIFSIHKNELNLIPEMLSIIEDETYKVKKYAGKNFLDLKEI